MSKKEPSQIKRDILLRVRLLYVMFVLAGVAIVGKVLYTQYGPNGNELRAKGERITYERVSLEAVRGDILARDGRILATSVPTYEIRMDFAADGLPDSVFNKDVDSLALCLSSMFKNRSKDEYLRLLRSSRENRLRNRNTLLSTRRINFEELHALRKFPIMRRGQNRGGLIVRQINHRLKPHKSLASRTIGMTNTTGTKLGVEGAFDNKLSGTNGNILMQKVSGQFRIPISDELSIEPINGMDVRTTLNVDIQDVAENALRTQLEKAGAQWGTVVLMEVATGEIHAMANLTRKPSGEIVEDFNYAIGMNLEPGSTFKLATLIALVEDGKMSLDHTIDLEGGDMWIGKAHVRDSHKGGGVETLREVFAKSSNVGFAKAVNEIYANDPNRFVDFMCDKIALDKPLDIQIAGEAKPVVKHPGERWWDKTTLTMMAYGYALRCTPLKTLALYNAVANNGVMVRPLLVKEISQYGAPVRAYETEVMSEAMCSPQTIAKVRDCLESVVDQGTAKFLHSPYYRVAAKTGTAQIAMGKGGYTDASGGRHYLGTLVGYFPADAPKYSCIVAIKTYVGGGSYGLYYGGSLSGPVFKAIADRVYASSTSWQKAVESDRKVRNTESMSIKRGRAEIVEHSTKKLGIPTPVFVDSTEQTTAEDSVILTETGQEITFERATVPNVVGMGLKDAIFALESAGLKVSFSGKGRVTKQSRTSGATTRKGEKIDITLNDIR